MELLEALVGFTELDEVWYLLVAELELEVETAWLEDELEWI